MIVSEDFKFCVWRRTNGTCFYGEIFSKTEGYGEELIGFFTSRDDAKLFCAFMSDANFCKQALERINIGGKLSIRIEIKDATPEPVDIKNLPELGSIQEIKEWACVCGYLNRGVICTHCGKAFDNPERVGLSTSQSEAAKK